MALFACVACRSRPPVQRLRARHGIESVAETELPWFNEQGPTAYTRAYHRPLSWYVRSLRTADPVLTALEEPAPTA